MSLLYRVPAKFGSGPCDQCDPHPWGLGSYLTPLHNRPLPLPVSPSPPQPPPPPARRLLLLCPVRPQCPRPWRKPRGGAARGARRRGGGGDFSERCPTRANRKRQQGPWGASYRVTSVRLPMTPQPSDLRLQQELAREASFCHAASIREC